MRKLFSIYKYKISSSASSGSMSKSSMNNKADDSPGLKFDHLADEGKFTSCMHFYKRDLTPVKENFAAINPKTPYRQSFENYDINVLTKDFKAGL